VAIWLTQMSARAKTGLLSAALALIALALAARSALTGAHHSAFPQPLAMVALAVTFFMAEQYLVNIEFRRQSHSLTFAGVPLALGILLLPVHELVIARLVGSLLALLLQHISAEKIVYNTAAFAFEAALSGTIIHLWFVPTGQPSVADIAGLLTCIAVVDQLMSALVLWVIRIHGGPLSRRDIAEVLLPSLMLSLVATVFAAGLRILLRAGFVGDMIAFILVLVAILIYRIYASTARRHQSLAMVHDFVTEGVGSATLEELANHSLTRIRQVLRASAVELQLYPGAAGVNGNTDKTADLPLRLTVDEDDQLTVSPSGADPADWVQSKALHQGEATLATHSGGDAATVRWLDARKLRDAVVVPLLAGSDVLGTIIVTDRLGDTATFTTHDLALLQTLTSHLAFAIRSTRLVEKLGHEATHDSLTGLVNRTYLANRISAVRPSAEGAAVLLLDLDKFKEVNDVLGHDIGDRLLIVVANRLRACLPGSAIIARLGGDEFAVLLTGLAADPEAAATELARHAVAEILRPVHFDEAVLTPEASVGIALSPDVRTGDLLRCADTAMYAAKASHDSVIIYHSDMDRGRAERLALVADLRIALDNQPHQFALAYQPKIDLITSRVVSAEALVRWNHPSLGVLPPDRFIPLAEATGLIDRLTEHVLTSALNECAQWNKRGHQVTVAVNLSSRNVADTTLPARVSAALDAAGVAPRSLILEITETSIMEDPDRAVYVADELAELGVRLSLDDFGTGYSSLSYLQRLPVTELKIDRSFVAGLSSDNATNAQALIRSITGLAANLGLTVVAEGIEDRNQLDQVTDLGCHIGQGYLIARPLSTTDFHAWLDHHAANSSSNLRLVRGPA
jgi:diguanylate cyclase (GGDEF)-like protein